MSKEKRNYKWYQQPIPLWLLLLGVTGAWGGYWIIIMITSITVGTDSSIWAIRGQFGDMFGALNALFSGLAFAGIIFTIRQQKEELELQREELKMTREELAKSSDAQKKTEQHLKLTAQLNAYSAYLELNAKMKEFFPDMMTQELLRDNLEVYTIKMSEILEKLEKEDDEEFK